jgi:AraC-like DNA-binding protein
MSLKHDDLSETHMLGPGTRQIVVRADMTDSRDWLRKTPVCATLTRYRMAHVGVCEAKAPYRIVRMKQSGTYFMGCFGGEGRILVDGRWQICRAGMGCLLPPHMLNAFHAVPGKIWEFVWVRYQATEEQGIAVTASSPMLAAFDAEGLRHAVLGLHAECREGQAASLHHWVELIQGYVLRFAQPLQMDERLSQLWSLVESRLGEEWTVESLAAECHVSGEHLRRLCMQQLGRPPMRHLTWLRMRAAAAMLTDSGEKVETVSRAVGYMNPFVFSTTFKRWIGWRPSEHRGRSMR